MYLKIYIDRNVTELSRDIVIKYFEKGTVYENEREAREFLKGKIIK